jgi:photosystem II stability/assembly factor-like uncharacterized protein
MKRSFSIAVLLVASACFAQWTPQTSGTTASLRGISVVDARVAWASGTKGTYLRTTDGGETWTAAQVPGAEALDFRDVQAFEANTAYLLAAGPGEASRIFKTTDAGAHWMEQYANHDPKGFLDCMAFWDAQHGIVVGDPVGGRFTVLLTSDGGTNWTPAPERGMPAALDGEGAFAASGTCVAVAEKKNAWFVTGGAAVARVFRTIDAGKTWTAVSTPFAAGKEGSGIFSVAFADTDRGVVVGGDYKTPAAANANAAWTSDSGKTWKLASELPAGYRSAVAVVPNTQWPTMIAVGTTGSDYSIDGGRTWKHLADGNFNAVAFAAPDNGYAVGPQGAIVRVAGSAPGGKRPTLK